MSGLIDRNFELDSRNGGIKHLCPGVVSLDRIIAKGHELVDDSSHANPDAWDEALMNGGLGHIGIEGGTIAEQKDSAYRRALSALEDEAEDVEPRQEGPDEFDELALIIGSNRLDSSGNILPSRGVLKTTRREAKKTY